MEGNTEFLPTHKPNNRESHSKFGNASRSTGRELHDRAKNKGDECDRTARHSKETSGFRAIFVKDASQMDTCKHEPKE
ncbi:hypothetical protein Ancab_016313 [Ancistrocladus abbreviatus]